MKVLAIIPARSGSKGVPGKNIRILGKKPLIAYTIESALESNFCIDVIVSTEDEKIASVARHWGAEVPFIRPPELASDTAKSVDVVVHALKFLLDAGRSYDAVCLLQPTSPFRPKGFIDEAILYFNNSGADALVSVLPVPEEYNPHWVFKPDANDHLHISTGDTLLIPRRQDLPIAYFRDGSIYLTRTDVLLSKNSLYGGSLAYILGEKKYFVNIDTKKDWHIAEQYCLKLFKK